MPQFHKVEQGEHLSRIAAKYGFSDYKTIYDHPQNAQIKKKRPNPNVLFPGDIFYIPDKQDKAESRGTGSVHQFKTPAAKLKVRIALGRVGGDPMASAKCRYLVESSMYLLTADGKGLLEQTIAASAEKGELNILADDYLLEGIGFPTNIGHLDPVEEVSGQRARLLNLGYYLAGLEENPEEFRSAVEEFQCDNHIKVDGVCGPEAQAKLKQAHGC